MNETLAMAQPGRREPAAGYDDTQAMNDVHALVTGLAEISDNQVASSVREIVARTGRPLYRARMITAAMTEDRHGMPAAEVDADGIVISVGQDPDGPGALVQIMTGDAAERSALVVVIDGRPVTSRVAAGWPGHDGGRR